MDKIKEQMEMDSLVSNILKACEEKGRTHREISKGQKQEVLLINRVRLFLLPRKKSKF